MVETFNGLKEVFQHNSDSEISGLAISEKNSDVKTLLSRLSNSPEFVKNVYK